MALDINGYGVNNAMGNPAVTANGPVAEKEAADGVANVAGILPGDGVTMTDGVRGDPTTGAAQGASAVPPLEEPERRPDAAEILEKLVAYLRLDNDETQLQAAKQRIEANRNVMEAEHAARTKKLGLFLAILGDPDAMSDASPADKWMSERMAHDIRIIARAVRNGGFCSSLVAACALRDLIHDLTGERVGLFKAWDFLDEMQEAFQGGSRGMARMFVAFSILGLIAGGGLKTDDAGNHPGQIRPDFMSAMKAAVAAGALAAVAADKTGSLFAGGRDRMEAGDLDKFVTMMQKRMEVDEEAINQIFVQLAAGIAGAIALIDAANGADAQIDRSGTMMA